MLVDSEFADTLITLIARPLKRGRTETTRSNTHQKLIEYISASKLSCLISQNNDDPPTHTK